MSKYVSNLSTSPSKFIHNSSPSPSLSKGTLLKSNHPELTKNVKKLINTIKNNKKHFVLLFVFSYNVHFNLPFCKHPFS